VNKYRKQILFGVLIAILLYYGGDWLLETLIRGPLAALDSRKDSLGEEIAKTERDLARFRKQSKDMDLWRRQSLPSDPEKARSLYQAWLLELVKHVEMTDSNVDSSEPASRKGMFRVISVALRGRGSLEQLTRFLYDFYSAAHLHQIRTLSITPIQGKDLLDLSITVEALILPTADRKERLSSRHSDRLASDHLEDYLPIVQRNLFGMGGGARVADYAYLTAVNYVDGAPEAWFSLRTNDSLLKLRKGERLEIGSFKGVIAEISDADVILESDGERWLLSIGESLAQAAALPPEF
jgi:hypothetical protein